MIFTETIIGGLFIVELERLQDERGFFARSWCRSEFERRGLQPQLAQCNVSFNNRAGTVRGMHFQAAPHAETKLVRCTKGAIYDAIIDLRPGSPSFKKWTGLELSAYNRKMLYIPEGCAHGFQTLQDETEVFYQMSTPYVPGFSRGVRWNDPAFGFNWPLDVSLISPNDKNYPDFQE